MSFSSQVKEDVLVACGRCCCLCQKFCGNKIEIHHIKPRANGGADDMDNAIPLCFDCHADMSSYDHKHPKGNKYTRSELKRHRDEWYKKVTDIPGKAIQETSAEVDKKVYSTVIQLMPWDKTMQFIRTNNFAGFSFEQRRLDDFYKFIDHSNPGFQFIDPELEGLRIELRKQIHEFMSTIVHNTFHTSTPGWSSVPEEWEADQPERFDRVVATLHKTAEKICETYDILIKTANRKLGVV